MYKIWNVPKLMLQKQVSNVFLFECRNFGTIRITKLNIIKYLPLNPKKKKKWLESFLWKAVNATFFFFFCHHLCSPDYFQFGNWKWHVVLLKNKLFKIKYAWLLRELTFLKKKKNKKWKSCSWLCLLKLKKEKSLHVLSAKLTAS